MLLELSQIDEIAGKAASSILKKGGVSRVSSKPTLDSDGKEALEVTVILNNDRSAEVTGDLALDTIVKIGRNLSQSGEERFPIVRFATEEELAAGAILDANGDAEP